jgi:hypothetical protein
MWHHSFDPHSDVPEVPKAELKPMPFMAQSESVSSYLENIGGVSKIVLVNKALDKTRDEIATETMKDPKLLALSR